MDIEKTTFFNRLPVTFKGSGTNLYILHNNSASNTDITNQISALNFSLCKVVLDTADPSISSFNQNNAYYDSLWATESRNISTSNFKKVFDALKAKNIKAILCVNPPLSYMDSENNSLSSSDAIVSFAKYVVSCFIFCTTSLGADISYLEIFNFPDLESPRHISPNNLALLSENVRKILLERNVFISLLGPGTSFANISDRYIENLLYNKYTFDSFSVQGLENVGDISVINNGNITAKKYLYTSLQKINSLFNSVKLDNLRIVTKLATNATTLPNMSIIDIPENTLEYAFRITENVCNCLNSGYSYILFGDLSPFSNQQSLYKSNGDTRPFYQIVKFLLDNLQLNQDVYSSEELNKNDTTVKALMSASDSSTFSFILCRGDTSDLLNNELRLGVKNSVLNSEYTASTFSFVSFPVVDLTGINTDFTFTESLMSVNLKNLPNNCVLIFKVSVNRFYNTKIQIPTFTGTPSGSNFSVGTIYYNSVTDKTRIFNGSAFVDTVDLF